MAGTSGTLALAGISCKLEILSFNSVIALPLTSWGGWGVKMQDFSIKHKISKYKTIFKLSLKPQSRKTAIICSFSFFVSLVFYNSPSSISIISK
ncbi:hypothetical protein M2326_002706 [Flavobacterium sp. 7A]|nr:hypothetical protein [Flavobacterium sp. 7A]